MNILFNPVRFLSLLIIANGMLFFLSGPGYSAYHTYFIVSASSLFVRSKPGTDSAVISQLKKDSLLIDPGLTKILSKIENKSNFWYKITLGGGKEGYVFGGFLYEAGGFDTKNNDLLKIVCVNNNECGELIAFKNYVVINMIKNSNIMGFNVYGRKKELNEYYSKYLSREAPLYKTDESFSFFAGLYGDNLMIDEGTSPEMRRIQLYNLTKREFLYRGIYFNTIEHVNENEIYVCAEPPLTGITNRGLTGKSFNFRLGKYFGDKIIHTSFDKLKGAIQEGDLSEADALFSNRILNLTTGKIRETNIIQVTFTEGGGRLFR